MSYFQVVTYKLYFELKVEVVIIGLENIKNMFFKNYKFFLEHSPDPTNDIRLPVTGVLCFWR